MTAKADGQILRDIFYLLGGLTPPDTTVNAFRDENGNIITPGKPESLKATYSAAAFGVALTVAGDIFTIGGASGKVIRINRISISGAATAAINVLVSVARRSTADTAGTPAAWTAVKHDIGDSAAAASGNSYSGGTAPTAGTLVGVVRAEIMAVPTAATTGGTPLVWEFGGRNGKPLIIRGALDFIVINVGAIGAGASMDIDIEWTEEAA